MSGQAIIDLYYDMSKNKLLEKGGSAYRRWVELKTRQRIKEINASKHTSPAVKKALIDQL